jgi:RNA polymerase sigma-70 factor, ECF subfamily
MGRQTAITLEGARPAGAVVRYLHPVNANPTRSGSGPSDAALVTAARANESWAVQALFQRHASMMNGLAYRLLGRDAEVDDVVQESFLRALDRLDSLKEPQAFAAWLGSIVVRTVSRLLRRRKLLSRLGLRRNDEPIDLDTLVSQSAPPDALVELKAIYAKIDRMPVDVRIPLLLRKVEGLPLEEIAERTGKSLATVKRRIADGERALVEAPSARKGPMPGLAEQARKRGGEER